LRLARLSLAVLSLRWQTKIIMTTAGTMNIGIINNTVIGTENEVTGSTTITGMCLSMLAL